jgi:hypothetical protein
LVDSVRTPYGKPRQDFRTEMGGRRWAFADMSASNFTAPLEPESPAANDLIRGVLWGILWVVWQGVRLPVLLLLVILEPVVSFGLSAAALLGVLTAFFWKLLGPPHFPFFLVLGISIGFEFALVLYHALLRLLGGR